MQRLSDTALATLVDEPQFWTAFERQTRVYYARRDQPTPTEMNVEDTRAFEVIALAAAREVGHLYG